MEIKTENVATYGLKTWEQTGTVAIDFANYLDKLPEIKGIELEQILDNGWHQVGFRFNKTLIDNTDDLKLDLVFSKKVDHERYEYGYVTRKVKKFDFLGLVVNFTAYASNQAHFERDDINWKLLERIEK